MKLDVTSIVFPTPQRSKQLDTPGKSRISRASLATYTSSNIPRIDAKKPHSHKRTQAIYISNRIVLVQHCSLAYVSPIRIPNPHPNLCQEHLVNQS
jgi:hypothetical protein